METNNQQLAPQIEYVYLKEQGPSKKLEKKLSIGKKPLENH